MNNVPESLLSWVIHYPGCWDTACYWTVYDALEELSGSEILDDHGFQCTNEDCPHLIGKKS